MATDPRPEGGAMSDASDASDACVPRTAPAGCTALAGLACDPVCQTGCCTSQKCSDLYSGTGPTLGCVPNKPSFGLLQPCTPSNSTTPQRADNCNPGLVCVDGLRGSFCLKLCRTDDDCGTVKCEDRPIEVTSTSALARVCAIEKTPCDPTNAANSGCPAGRFCYLTDTDPTGDTTVCEITTGDARRTDACLNSRDCFQNLTCTTKGSTIHTCQPVCSHASATDTCLTMGTQCQATGKDFDYCF